MRHLASRAAIRDLFFNVTRASASCPCHGWKSTSTRDMINAGIALRNGGRNSSFATSNDPSSDADYAFEVAASNLRFGKDVTAEIGMDFANMKATKVGIFTDPTVARLRPMKRAIESLEMAGVSWTDAIRFAKEERPSHFLAVGGGSTIDTCKVANLFSCYPEAELLDFVNAPVGKGRPIDKVLKPLIAVPTTAGTGSETTGVAIFDYEPLLAKTGIASRELRPKLGVVDFLNTMTCPREVHISSGLDVLFHSLESYTAIPYNERRPRPQNPMNRPAYQGRNPYAPH